VNILATLISVISIGGIISAMAALIWPLAGSVIAWLLYYPTHGLIVLVEFFCYQEFYCRWHNFCFAVAGDLWADYLAWLQHWWQRRWWLAGFIAVALVLIPIWQNPRCFAPPCCDSGRTTVIPSKVSITG